MLETEPKHLAAGKLATYAMDAKLDVDVRNQPPATGTTAPPLESARAARRVKDVCRPDIAGWRREENLPAFPKERPIRSRPD